MAIARIPPGVSPYPAGREPVGRFECGKVVIEGGQVFRQTFWQQYAFRPSGKNGAEIVHRSTARQSVDADIPEDPG